MQLSDENPEANNQEAEVKMLKAEIAALRMAVVFLISEVDIAGHGDTSSSIIEGLMGQQAHAVGKDVRICFAIEDICEMITSLQDA